MGPAARSGGNDRSESAAASPRAQSPRRFKPSPSRTGPVGFPRAPAAAAGNEATEKIAASGCSRSGGSAAADLPAAPRHDSDPGPLGSRSGSDPGPYPQQGVAFAAAGAAAWGAAGPPGTPARGRRAGGYPIQTRRDRRQRGQLVVDPA